MAHQQSPVKEKTTSQFIEHIVAPFATPVTDQKKLKRRPAVARGDWFNQKMHQLQFKHLIKNKDQKQRILFGESLYIFKLDTFYSHMIIQTLCSYVPAGPQMCHSSKRQGDLRHFTNGSFIHKTTGDGGDFNEKQRGHHAHNKTQLLYHPATDQNKGAQLGRENRQFQQQKEVPGPDDGECWNGDLILVWRKFISL